MAIGVARLWTFRSPRAWKSRFPYNVIEWAEWASEFQLKRRDRNLWKLKNWKKTWERRKNPQNYDVFLFLKDFREEVGLSYFAKLSKVRRTKVILSGFKAVFRDGRASQKQLRGFQKQLKVLRTSVEGFKTSWKSQLGDRASDPYSLQEGLWASWDSLRASWEGLISSRVSLGPSC